MLIRDWCIHDLGEDAPGVAGFVLLRFDYMIRNRFIHRLDHVGNIRSKVRTKGRHQADSISEDRNMAEDMTSSNKDLECTLVVLLEVGSVQEACARRV